MNTTEKLKICNRLLGLTLILMLASGIQLEATAGSYTWSVWVHFALVIILTVLSICHIYLHYRFSNWFVRFAKKPQYGHTSSLVGLSADGSERYCGHCTVARRKRPLANRRRPWQNRLRNGHRRNHPRRQTHPPTQTGETRLSA